VRKSAKTVRAFKLLRHRRDGSYGPLFIDRSRVINTGVWLKAESVPTPGFAFRPGWHAAAKPFAPHLSIRGRQWCAVTLRGVKEHIRPATQGGLWYTAKYMRVEFPLNMQFNTYKRRKQWVASSTKS